MRKCLSLWLLLIASPAYAAEVCVTIPQAKVAILASAKDAYNAANGTSLSTQDWALLMVRRAAIAWQLESAAATFVAEIEQAEQDELAAQQAAAADFDAARAVAEDGWE